MSEKRLMKKARNKEEADGEEESKMEQSQNGRGGQLTQGENECWKRSHFKNHRK